MWWASAALSQWAHVMLLVVEHGGAWSEVAELLMVLTALPACARARRIVTFPLVGLT